MRYLAPLVIAFLLLVNVQATAANLGLTPSCSGNDCSGGANYGLVPKDSNVTQPDTTDRNSSSDSSQNLGLAPDTAAAQESQTSSSLQPSTSTLPTIDLKNTGKTTLTPGGTVSGETIDKQSKMDDFIRATGLTQQNPSANIDYPPIKKYMEEQARNKIKPPLILEDHDFSENPALQKDLPYTLAIGMAANYMWGASDVKQINERLGYNAQQIPANCQLRIDGFLSTNKGHYHAITYAGQATTVKYEGVIQDVHLVPSAVCNTPRGTLPQTGGILRRVGDKLAVQLLNRINCKLTRKSMSTIEVVYNGDNGGTCSY